MLFPLIKSKKTNIVLLIIISFSLFQFSLFSQTENFTTIKELDEKSIFSFSIMSDNKGDEIKKKPFKRMVDWMIESDKKFVIGLGDHVKKKKDPDKNRKKNKFLDFLTENDWWHNNFYPNIADGENEYYGEGQGDFGAGYPFLEHINLDKRKNTRIRDNKCEYYSQIEIEGGFVVHLIQLHYSDTPDNEKLAFNQSTRDYLIKTISAINKREDKDIIIVGAHSKDGIWIDKLNKNNRKIVMEKADLLLSATTHIFNIFDVEGYYSYEEKENELRTINRTGALCINTGAITHARGFCPNGFVEVHVLKSPFRMVVQYINAEGKTRKLQPDGYAVVKIIDGKIYYPGFKF